jgi:hypothetical protein
MSKGFASFIRIVGCLVAALQVVAVLTTRDSYDPNTWAILVSLISAVLLPVLAFSYAKLIDTTLANTEDIQWVKNSLEERVSSLQERLSAQGVPSAKTTTDRNGSPDREEKTAEPDAVEPIPDPDRPGRVTCPRCGMPQQNNRVRCLDCGVPFVTK